MSFKHAVSGVICRIEWDDSRPMFQSMVFLTWRSVPVAGHFYWANLPESSFQNHCDIPEESQVGEYWDLLFFSKESCPPFPVFSWKWKFIVVFFNPSKQARRSFFGSFSKFPNGSGLRHHNFGWFLHSFKSKTAGQLDPVMCTKI